MEAVFLYFSKHIEEHASIPFNPEHVTLGTNLEDELDFA
jgi:hypothetical protein